MLAGMADSTAARNARLQTLVTATTAWATARTTQLQNQVNTAQTILNNRSGATQMAQAGVSATMDLVNDEIDSFLS